MQRAGLHAGAYERLLALRPSDALLWYVRAGQHLMRGNAGAAVADFIRGGKPPATNEFAYEYAAAAPVGRRRNRLCPLRLAPGRAAR